MIADLCLCEYTSHGHCGVVRPDGSVDNDATLELLARTAVSQARAGADIIAPSDMMDGRVGVIRTALDDDGLVETPILAYSAKFASAFYGPFREAADSAPAFGDRRAYQMDPANGREAVREARLDIEEGADIVMVKPALPYLDLVWRVKNETGVPLGRLQRQRRVRDGQGRRGRRLPRRARDRTRAPDRDPASGGRHHRHLPREGRGAVAAVTPGSQHGPKLRSRKLGAAVSLDDLDKRLLNLMQGSFPIAARPYRHVAQQAGIEEQDVIARVRELLEDRIIRQVTPIFDTRALGYSSMLVAAKVDPDNPWRAAKVINEHPGVSHNYLRNHEFNIWFTIATEPDSPLGLEATLDVLGRIAGAESIRQLPTLKLFKIRMDLEMEGGTDALAKSVEVAPPAETERQPYDEFDIAVIRALQGDMPVVPEPYAPAAQELGISQEQLLGHLHAMQERRLLRRVAAILFHRRAGFSANGMGVWKVPDDRIMELGPQMAAYRGISHCYQRPTYRDWPYSVFTMAHGRSKEECDAILDSIALDTGVSDRATLYSSTEFKKIRLLYFTDDYRAWERKHAGV